MKKILKMEKWMDMALSNLIMKIDMQVGYKMMYTMELVFGIILMIKLKDKENGQMERD